MKRTFRMVIATAVTLLLSTVLSFIYFSNHSQPEKNACEHTYGEWIVERQATCKEEGLLTRSCTKCDYMEVTKSGKTNDHTESGWIVDIEATKTEDGKKHTECTVCGVRIAEDSIPATGPVGLDYELNPDKASYTVKGIGTCTDTDIVIPHTYNGLLVTSVGNGAFHGCDSLQSITIPDGVTSIGVAAFSNCTSLQSITIPDSVTSIGEDAFFYCTSLQSITIPDSVTLIGRYAFYHCTSLQSITIPDSVIYIDRCTFFNCTSLTSVTIGDSVTTIGYRAFAECTGLTNITFQGTMAQWKKISLASYWNYKVPATEVICSDGTVRLTQG